MVSRWLPWTLFVAVIAASFVAWADLRGWDFGSLSALALFPLLGLLAWSIMWTHYALGGVRLVYPFEHNQLYSRVSAVVVLACLLLHPGLLAWGQFDLSGTLPPGSFYSYVAPSLKGAVLLGTISLIIFISFDVFEFFKKRAWVQRNWKWISLSQMVAMTSIFIDKPEVEVIMLFEGAKYTTQTFIDLRACFYEALFFDNTLLDQLSRLRQLPSNLSILDNVNNIHSVPSFQSFSYVTDAIFVRQGTVKDKSRATLEALIKNIRHKRAASLTIVIVILRCIAIDILHELVMLNRNKRWRVFANGLFCKLGFASPRDTSHKKRDFCFCLREVLKKLSTDSRSVLFYP